MYTCTLTSYDEHLKYLMHAYHRQNRDILCLSMIIVSIISRERMFRLDFISYPSPLQYLSLIAGKRQVEPPITPGVMDAAKLSANSCNAVVRAVAQSILSLADS